MTETIRVPEAPEPPEEFNADAVSKWYETWARLDHAYFDLSCDRDTLIAYCMAYADWHHADRMVAACGKEYEDPATNVALRPDGQVAAELMLRKSELVLNPYVKVRNRADARMGVLGERLGFSPRALKTTSWRQILPLLMEPPGQKEARPAESEDCTSGICKPGNTQQPKFWTIERVWRAVQECRGNLAAAARALTHKYGVECTPQTLSRLVKTHPELRAACEEAREASVDCCRCTITQRAIAGDAVAQAIFLETFDPRFKSS